MNSNNLEIDSIKGESNSFLNINQQPFTELLTFVDFADDKLNIGLVEINFAKDRDILIEALKKHPDCQNIQFEILDFPDPNLRFLRDELVAVLTKIKIAPDKKLILLLTGLEKSIGILGEYPSVLANLNFVRDDLRTSVPHPMLLFLPDYALTRLARYAPDFWAWNRKVFCFKSNRSNLLKSRNDLIVTDKSLTNLKLPAKQERIDLLLHLLNEYNSLPKEEIENNLPTISNIYKQLGKAYNFLGAYQQAINYHQQSLEISQKIEDRHGISSSLNNLGGAYHSLGEYQKAINYHQQSLEIAREIEDRHGISSSLHSLGNAYYSLGEYQQAIDYYQQSLEISQEIEDRNGISSSLNNLGIAYHSLGEYQKAINYHQKSLEIAREIEDRNGISRCLNSLGSAYYSLGEYQQAIDYYQQSLEIKTEIGDRHGEANTWFNLGLTWQNLQQNSEAKTAYENARKLYQAIGLDKEVKDCDRAIQNLA